MSEESKPLFEIDEIPQTNPIKQLNISEYCGNMFDNNYSKTLYCALALNMLSTYTNYCVYKSKNRCNDQSCQYDGDIFAIEIITPYGIIISLFSIAYWDIFDIPEVDCIEYTEPVTMEKSLERLAAFIEYLTITKRLDLAKQIEHYENKETD